MAKAMKTSGCAKNALHRAFVGLGPRKALLTDITCMPFHGPSIYLSTIIDACTKGALAHQTPLSPKEDFAQDALEELKEKHGSELSCDTIIRSDRGCHCNSRLFIDTIEEMELVRSMPRRGNCWGNAPQESFFGHMKDEIGGKIGKCETVEKAVEAIDGWFEYCNGDRPIWGLGKRTPDEYREYLEKGGKVIRTRKKAKRTKK